MSRDEPLRIGVDLGGTKIEAALLDNDGNVLRRRRDATPRGDYRGTLTAVGSLVDAMREGIEQPTTVGVCGPGAVSPATGRMKNANSVWLNGRPLLRDLERELGDEIRLANDADCFALSEALDGAACGARSVFGAILGTGVGGGLVLGGKLLAGPNAIAGEWGHNPLPWRTDLELPGPRCYCGLHGCIETFLAGPGLARDHEAGGGARATATEIAALAAGGDVRANATLERYESRLTRALATVINLIDPEVIVLGGGLSNLGRLYENVPTGWPSFVFSDRVDTRLVPPVHGDSSGVRGAASLWRN